MLPIITFIYPLFGILIMLIILFYGVVTNVSLNFTSKTKHNYLMWALSFGVLAGMYGYTFDYTYNDLFRYAEQIVYYFNGNISTIFTNDSELLYVRDILFHIVSNIGDVHILPFIVGFVTYSIVFLNHVVKGSQEEIWQNLKSASKCSAKRITSLRKSSGRSSA